MCYSCNASAYRHPLYSSQFSKLTATKGTLDALRVTPLSLRAFADRSVT